MINKRPWILDLVEKAGHKVFDNGDYDLNIVGIRKANGEPNKFDDLITCSYKVNGVWQFRSWRCTTDPGNHWMENPMRVEGTAILKAGQYRGVYMLSKHRGKYLALCQNGGPVTVWRDKDRDLEIDQEVEHTGMFGINIHRAHAKIEVDDVYKYSAGCQVLNKPGDLDELLWLCKRQIATHPTWPQKFSYTLLEESDFKTETAPKKSKPKAKKK